MAVKGNFKDICFNDMVGLLYRTRKTGRMEITFQGKWAMVIFKEGDVWHVEPRGYGGASGEEVFEELLKMTDGNWVFQRVQVLPTLPRTLTLDMTPYAGADVVADNGPVDEETGLPQNMGEGGKAIAQVLRFKPGAEVKVRYVPQNVKKLLQGIDGQRNVTDVIQLSQIDAAQAAQIIQELIKQDVVEVFDPTKPPEAPPA
jgi:hypothetical protein